MRRGRCACPVSPVRVLLPLHVTVRRSSKHDTPRHSFSSGGRPQNSLIHSTSMQLQMNPHELGTSSCIIHGERRGSPRLSQTDRRAGDGLFLSLWQRRRTSASSRPRWTTACSPSLWPSSPRATTSSAACRSPSGTHDLTSPITPRLARAEISTTRHGHRMPRSDYRCGRVESKP